MSRYAQKIMAPTPYPIGVEVEVKYNIIFARNQMKYPDLHGKIMYRTATPHNMVGVG